MKPLSAIKEDVLSRVAAKGFTAIYVGGDKKNPPYAYTVGLCAKTKDQREIIVFGLPADVAIHVLNIVGDRLIDGEDIPLREDIDQVIQGFSVRLAPVSAKSFGDFGHMANWYARDVLKRGRRVQGLQLLWPDRFGMFPGTPGFTANESQPLL